jgi:radical SAM superfamily enzyme YgiQ (UPF0313 family)
MARIAFISLYDRNANGIRLMSANLKRHGHECHVIFLKRYSMTWNEMAVEVGEYPWMGVDKTGRVFKYASNSHVSDTEFRLLRETLARIEPDVIGLTVNTPLRTQNHRVTRFLQEHFDVPVVWGGYDPTVNAADCLSLCDYACVGEGDQTILEIADRIDRGASFDDVCNLAYLRDGRVQFNRKAPAEQNLDSYPWRDNAPDDKYLIEDDALVERYPVVNDKDEPVYQAMSARGCPYQCSYCCEATLKELYAGEKFLRRRSPEDLIGELEHAKRDLGVQRIHFEDEIFAMNLKWLRDFAPLYKERIGLPFTAYIYPCRDIEGILTVLKDAGLDYCCLALESGSERINKQVFSRVYDRELFLKTARLCKQLGIKYYTDVITYSPYEEEEDLQKTLDVLVEMGGGFGLCVNKLFVLPGTKMAEKMARDGLVIGDSARDAMFNYYCRLFWITSFTKHARPLVWAIQRMRVFRERPELLRPEKIEELLERLARPGALLRSRLRALAGRGVPAMSPELPAS